jgi:PAS domain S-box-containing protein
MNKRLSISQILLWLSMVVVMVGVISTGIITNITLRSVEKQLPRMLLTELNDLSIIIENLSDVVIAARINQDNPDLKNLNLLRKKIEPVYKDIVRLRESYVFDNLVQASAFHAVVAPAITDLQTWLHDGVSGLKPEDKTTAKIIFLRINNAYQKARLVNRESRMGAQTKLIEQQKRLGHFITNANLLFVLTIIITFGMVFLLIRQYALQLRESKAQSELREQRDLLSVLFENVSLGITLWGKTDNFLFSNNGFTEITGYSKNDIQTLGDWFSLAYPDRKYRNKVLNDWKDSSYKKEAIRQFKVACKSGEMKDIEFRAAFLKDGRSLVTMSDTTWRVKAEEEKINAQKLVAEHKKLSLVGQIAGKIAHDFNNILGIIMGNAELALLSSKEEEATRIFNLIFKQTIRGKNLTKNLIAFAKDQEPKQEFFKISEKINLVINLLRKDLEGIEIVKEEISNVPDLLADPGMIEHALVNLMQNSVHALSNTEHPKIIIRVFCRNDNICLNIEDNGCGIPDDHMESIFDPGFTLKGSKDEIGAYTPGIKGTGYGMANVKKYIEQHNGEISVQSILGSGTKSTISLPVINKELTKKEKEEITEEIAFSGKHILLVEDEPSLSEVQYRVLTNEPCMHKVDIAQNGRIAKALFDKNEYDFISLDYVLPGNINGMNVYNHIRETNKNIPILFISGNIEFLESIKDLKQRDACIDHLSKPCRNKDYVKCINKLLVSTSITQH